MLKVGNKTVLFEGWME